MGWCGFHFSLGWCQEIQPPKSRWPWPCGAYVLGGRQILTLFTHSLCISKESVKKTSHSVYCKYEGIQGGKSEVCLMLQGREPPLLSWFSGAHPEAAGKLPGATSACNPNVGAPQEAHLGIASGLMSAHLSGCSTSEAQCLSFSSTDHVSHQCLNGQL